MAWLKRGSRQPSTLIGRFLAAGVLRQHDRRRILRAELDRTGWVDADKVAAEAFDIVVKWVYGKDVSTVAVPEMVAAMRSFYGADGVDRVPQEAAEALVRDALGEDVDVSRIPPAISFSVRSLIFAGLATDLTLGEREVNSLLIQAEARAKDQGFRPTTAN